MSNLLNTTIVRDDEFIYFGTSGPFRMRYSVSNTRLELTDTAGSVLAHWTDAGTTGNMTLTGAMTVSGSVTAAGLSATTGFINIGTSSTLTIASGEVTATRSRHLIDTEAAAASDDLVTINGGGTNDLLVLSTVSSSRDVVLKHATGNIVLAGAADLTLGSSNNRITLVKNSTGNWVEIARAI
jgi:hypothetical protein